MKRQIKIAGLSAIGLALLSDACSYFNLTATAGIFESLAIFGVMFILVFYIANIPIIKSTLKRIPQNDEGHDE